MADFLNDPGLLEEPHVDIHQLFMYYNTLYFQNKLGAVSVEWSSKRMTMCGGTTQKVPGGAIVKLSQPLLQFRPSEDIKDVLLHELIHAYCMVEELYDADPTGHGVPFNGIMQRINSSTVPDMFRPARGYKISQFHTMIDELEHYRQHHWQCDRCSKLVKRANNRPPQPADCRRQAKTVAACNDSGCYYHMHIKNCGGNFIKIKEPEGYKPSKKAKTKDSTGAAAAGGNNTTGTSNNAGGGDNANNQKSIKGFFTGKSYRLGGGGGDGDGDGGGRSNNSNTSTEQGGGVLPSLIAAVRATEIHATNTATTTTAAAEDAAAAELKKRRSEAGRKGGLAAAAKRRAAVEGLFGPYTAPTHRNTSTVPQQQQQQQPSVMQLQQQDILGNTTTTTTATNKNKNTDVEVIDLVSSDSDDEKPAPVEVKEEVLQCPICNKTWPVGSIMTSALNRHIDECLVVE